MTTKAAVIPSAGSKAASTAAFTFTRVELGRQRLVGQYVTQGPRCGRGIGKCAFYLLRREVNGFFADGQRHATLVPEIFGGADHPAGKGQVHFFVLIVNDPLGDMRSFGVGTRKVTDVLGGEIGVEPGDEHGRAQDLGEA